MNINKHEAELLSQIEELKKKNLEQEYEIKRKNEDYQKDISN